MSAVKVKMALADVLVSAAVLREHYLFHVQCDHATRRDNPVCSCTVVNLGWHDSVGQAVEAWVEHVQSVQRERLVLRGPDGGARCNFCGVVQVQAAVLVKAPKDLSAECYICSSCVEEAQGCVDEHWDRVWKKDADVEYESWYGPCWNAVEYDHDWRYDGINAVWACARCEAVDANRAPPDDVDDYPGAHHE